jgi:hypothetical protein
MLSDVLKNGRMVYPDAVARRPMKAVKSMTVTAVSLINAANNEGPCLAQSGRSRTGWHRLILDREAAFGPNHVLPERSSPDDGSITNPRVRLRDLPGSGPSTI